MGLPLYVTFAAFKILFVLDFQQIDYVYWHSLIGVDTVQGLLNFKELDADWLVILSQNRVRGSLHHLSPGQLLVSFRCFSGMTPKFIHKIWSWFVFPFITYYLKSVWTNTFLYSSMILGFIFFSSILLLSPFKGNIGVLAVSVCVQKSSFYFRNSGGIRKIEENVIWHS